MTDPEKESINQEQISTLLQSSRLHVRCHPRKEEITHEIENYFGKDWPFQTKKELKKIRRTDLTGVACYTFPTVHDDRMFTVVLILMMFVLVDDIVEDMSFKESELLAERFILISQHEEHADPESPIEYLICDVWRRIGEMDDEVANQIKAEFFSIWRNQAVEDRGKRNDFGAYLNYRVSDAGGTLSKLLLRFGLRISRSNCYDEAVLKLELNFANHITVTNDLLSFERELKKSHSSVADGASISSSVEVISRECQVNTRTAKLVLLTICREWERQHEELSAEITSRLPELSDYCMAVGYLMGGNEAWSKGASRYHNKPGGNEV
ncbi:unnamed protein product [Penicillium salamii]|nr:unnamed protein product [Penicillium salamii]CAG8403994.1 unnamed protein product [Penicillium salamii]